MQIALFYTLSCTALIVGLGVIILALNEKANLKWLYYHYFIRKPVNWSILILLLVWVTFIIVQENEFPLWAIIPLTMSTIGLVMTYKLHPENAFKALDYPTFSKNHNELPLTEEMEIAVIEYEGITKCYPLDYVIHHHIINDRFGEKTVSLTYCALCRSIIPFDVTELGPLFVGSMKNSNMVVADRRTKTFFQQESFRSVVGKLHPKELTMIPFQVLTWTEVKNTISNPLVVEVTQKDFRDFQLPIPGVWKRISKSEFTPGLSKKNHDSSFPARTRIIGVTDKSLKEQVFYLKNDIIEHKVVKNSELDIFLITSGSTVKAFKASIHKTILHISFENQKEILDKDSQTRWNIRGKYISGPINENLEIITISDEYWFAWKKYHSNSKYVKL